MTRFRESTFKQSMVILVILTSVLTITWMKVPSFQVWGHSMRLSFNKWPKTEVVEDMIATRHPAVLKVLAQHVRDKSALPGDELDQYPDFPGQKFGEFCVWKIGQLAYDLHMDGDTYSNAQNFSDFQAWLDDNYDQLEWNSEFKGFDVEADR